ncbi:MAG: transcriptional repressor NrdR [Thermoguttaceae bacterium]|nr:transcriptional repressor NrdR [Thermoguttaceae bacterium]MBR6481326.1 transcriptional repressor NrdR [Thermoguttaceae bacterium]MCR5358978.1 transcriptional regulator NrdR [Thermoguttaceae bacterium]
MKCPYCRADDDRVVDTRVAEDGFVIKRRRYCNVCNRRFTTYERIEVTNIRVVKRDGTRVPFDREKLRKGVERACWKRPVSEGQISALIARVETKIENDGENEIDTDYIGENVLACLRELDEVAYVRFASVYRKFDSVDDFSRELRSLLKDQSNKRRQGRARKTDETPE